jgi:hypothetical protein
MGCGTFLLKITFAKAASVATSKLLVIPPLAGGEGAGFRTRSVIAD